MAAPEACGNVVSSSDNASSRDRNTTCHAALLEPVNGISSRVGCCQAKGNIPNTAANTAVRMRYRLPEGVRYGRPIGAVRGAGSSLCSGKNRSYPSIPRRRHADPGVNRSSRGVIHVVEENGVLGLGRPLERVRTVVWGILEANDTGVVYGSADRLARMLITLEKMFMDFLFRKRVSLKRQRLVFCGYRTTSTTCPTTGHRSSGKSTPKPPTSGI